MLAALLETCRDTTLLCVAADLTLASAAVVTKSVAEWRRRPVEIGRRPAVFLFLAKSDR